MSEAKFCPQCGSQLVPADRFCGDCGFDTHTVATVDTGAQVDGKPTIQANSPPNTYQQPTTVSTSSYQPLGNPTAAPAGSYRPAEKAIAGNKNALIIMISILVLVFLGGGGFYWWLSRSEDTSKVTSAGKNTVQSSTNQPANQSTASAPQLDLSRASTYLPKPGLQCQFLVNYPFGTSGTMERISARVVPAEAVRVSEVEINKEDGETSGFGFHYVERADGTYFIYDQTPMEIFPVLKNNLTIGQTWDYQDEYGQVVWKVVDIGVSLNLGFTTLKNCLLVESDNRAVDFKEIVYYAPGMGRVLERSATEGTDFLKLTAFNSMDAGQAADIVKKWAPNYAEIKDDRTQY